MDFTNIKNSLHKAKVGFLGLFKGDDEDEATEYPTYDYSTDEGEEISEEEAIDRVEVAYTSLTEIDGIGEKKAESLREHGYKTIQDLQEASTEDLTKIDGIGEKTAEQMIFDSKKRLSRELH